MTHDSIILCENIHKQYMDADKKIDVLQGVNFDVKSGERVAIIGRSGSGKTTLINCLGGLEQPNQGTVTLNGVSMAKLNDRKRGYLRNRILGLVFQFHHLLPEFSALENVCMPLLIRGERVSRAIESARACLLKVGLAHREDHKPSTMSGGERQRVAIARAIVTNPKCVLADEPTGNLDNESADTVYELMMGLATSIGTSFVVVTHDMALANKMDRIVKLENGKLIDV
jgi:lipoprotein-releasing system ATP-binding protein